MTERRNDLAGLLRWYPQAWRERYGDELCALMEDQLAGRPAARRLRASIAVAGLRERARGAAVIGCSTPPAERARTGVLLVLGAWAAFLVAGAAYSKLAEHFVGALRRVDRADPSRAFDVVVVAAAIAAALFLAGVGIALPAFVRFLRAGGWPEIRRAVLAAVVVTGLALAVLGGLIPWAHSLSAARRNGADGLYSAGFLGMGLLVASAIGAWTCAAVRAARRLHLSRREMAAESLLAVALGAAMGTMTVGTAIWWGALAVHAPWFLHGTRAGTPESPFDLRLAATMALMAASVLVGEYGVSRIARAWRDMLRTHPA